MHVLENQPLVSIGLPTYNGANKIAAAITSVLDQDYSNIELVISDNASEDDTGIVCNEYAIKDNRVKYYRQEQNMGADYNFKFVFSHSTGNYFMWLGDDDWIDKSYISTCVNFLAGNPGYSLVCGQSEYWIDKKNINAEYDHNLLSDDPAGRVVEYCKHVSGNGVFYGVMPRDVLEVIGWAPRTMGFDWLHIARIAFLGKVATLKDVHVHRQISYTGESGGFEHMAKVYGFPEFQGLFPHLSISIMLHNDIMYGDGVYSKLSTAKKAEFAQCVQEIICKRWNYNYKGKFLKLLNTIALWQESGDDNYYVKANEIADSFYMPNTKKISKMIIDTQLVCNPVIKSRLIDTRELFEMLHKYIYMKPNKLRHLFNTLHHLLFKFKSYFIKLFHFASD